MQEVKRRLKVKPDLTQSHISFVLRHISFYFYQLKLCHFFHLFLAVGDRMVEYELIQLNNGKQLNKKKYSTKIKYKGKKY